MNKILTSFITTIVIVIIGIEITGCTQSARQNASPQPQFAGRTVQVTTAPPQTFNPAVTPPPPQATEKTAAYQGYYFNPQPAPIPGETPIREHHRHRYLHIVLRDGRCYLADNYGHFYDTGRDDNGDVYPVYQDPGTGANYPLYYDDDRDEYYRCVDDGDNGYYRNYVGDPDDEFYEGDPNQEEECQSEDCQPFVINFDIDYSNYSGYDPDYGQYHGHRYSRHNHDFIEILPVIVAAYILLQPSDNHGGDWHNGRQPVRVGNHNYYQNTVVVSNSAGHGGPHGGSVFAALPGPPIGHFQGYRQPRSLDVVKSGHRSATAAAIVHQNTNHPFTTATSRQQESKNPSNAPRENSVSHNAENTVRILPVSKSLGAATAKRTAPGVHFVGVGQNGRQVMAGAQSGSGRQRSTMVKSASRLSAAKPGSVRRASSAPISAHEQGRITPVSAKPVTHLQSAQRSAHNVTSRAPEHQAQIVHPATAQRHKQQPLVTRQQEEQPRPQPQPRQQEQPRPQPQPRQQEQPRPQPQPRQQQQPRPQPQPRQQQQPRPQAQPRQQEQPRPQSQPRPQQQSTGPHDQQKDHPQ
jgi:hypothetical protein